MKKCRKKWSSDVVNQKKRGGLLSPFWVCRSIEGPSHNLPHRFGSLEQFAYICPRNQPYGLEDDKQ